MTAVNVIFMILIFAAFVTSVVLWVMAIYGAFTRTDLKENKWLWVALLLFFAPIGVIAYFFVENKKQLGIISLVALLVIILGLPAFAIVSFVSRSLEESQAQPLPGQQNNFGLNSTDVELAPSK
jgi:FtsH-binding integral membrane protein